MIFTGAIGNFITVVAGTLVGLVAGKFLNERIRTATMSAVALITIGIAVPGLMNSSKPLVPILSLVVGTVIGEALMVYGTFIHKMAPFGFSIGFVSMVLATVIYIVVCLATKPQKHVGEVVDSINEFFAK